MNATLTVRHKVADRPAPGQRRVVRVGPDFTKEYPDADALSTEAFATLIVTGDALLAEHTRRILLTLGVSQTVAQALAVLDGASGPLTPSQIGERMLVSSGTMTPILDTLEHRGWIRRVPNREDRRSVLIEITVEGRAAADAFMPGLHRVERQMMSVLRKSERAQLLGLLAKVLDRANEIAVEPAEALAGARHRPARLA